MDHARCTIDNKTYTAFDFSHLPAVTLEEYRRSLVCAECEGPAFFRKQSTDGRAPCFGGRPHQAGCSLASQDGGAWGVEGNDGEDERFNPGDRIVVDLRLDVGGNGTPGGNASDRQHSQGRFFGGSNGEHRTRTYKRLKAMLRALVEGHGLAVSTQIIEVPGLIEMQAKDFFVAFKDAAGVPEKQYRGFWGSLSDARQGKDGAIFLNTGWITDPSIRVAEIDRDILLEMVGAANLEELSGAYILVLGNIGTPKENGKRFISHKGPLYLAMLVQKRK
jgi:hypothetical protein